jgi:hypothetical protein
VPRRAAVDAALPLTSAVAVAPFIFGILPAPQSIRDSLAVFGVIWEGAMLIGCVSILAGIAARWRHPSFAYVAESFGCVMAAIFSAIYAGALAYTYSPKQTWAAAWFVAGIGGFHFFRWIELRWLRKQAARSST